MSDSDLPLSFRDQIMDALLAHLQTQCGTTFRHYGRRFFPFMDLISKIDASDADKLAQPALLLFDGAGLGGGSDIFAPKGRASPGLVTMVRTIVIYATLPGGGMPEGPNPVYPGGKVFHPLIQSVENALSAVDATSQNTLTLGGLVSHVWLEGEGLMVTGELDETQGQGMQTLPVRILMWPRTS